MMDESWGGECEARQGRKQGRGCRVGARSARQATPRARRARGARWGSGAGGGGGRGSLTAGAVSGWSNLSSAHCGPKCASGPLPSTGAPPPLRALSLGSRASGRPSRPYSWSCGQRAPLGRGLGEGGVDRASGPADAYPAVCTCHGRPATCNSPPPATHTSKHKCCSRFLPPYTPAHLPQIVPSPVKGLSSGLVQGHRLQRRNHGRQRVCEGQADSRCVLHRRTLCRQRGPPARPARARKQAHPAAAAWCAAAAEGGGAAGRRSHRPGCRRCHRGCQKRWPPPSPCRGQR